jgi:F-type H+-transporting ATPase subunit gamma
MAQQQSIKRRIKSVRNTRQITKAMQMVSASKLRRAQAAAVGPKAYIEAANSILASLAKTAEALENPLFTVRPIGHAMTVLVTGDRSLAGAYNSNLFRAFGAHNAKLKVPHSVITIGKYGASHLSRISDIEQIAAYAIDSDSTDAELAQPVLAELVSAFSSGKVDVVHLVYTEFVSAIRQEVRIAQLLPIVPPAGEPSPMTLEPNPGAVLQAVLDGRASFFAAQMIAMKSATDNATDLIDDLTLAANNARQSAITQELAEISAGSEAITE